MSTAGKYETSGPTISEAAITAAIAPIEPWAKLTIRFAR